jgi:hypothetical protein
MVNCQNEPSDLKDNSVGLDSDHLNIPEENNPTLQVKMNDLKKRHEFEKHLLMLFIEYVQNIGYSDYPPLVEVMNQAKLNDSINNKKQEENNSLEHLDNLVANISQNSLIALDKSDSCQPVNNYQQTQVTPQESINSNNLETITAISNAFDNENELNRLKISSLLTENNHLPDSRLDTELKFLQVLSEDIKPLQSYMENLSKIAKNLYEFVPKYEHDNKFKRLYESIDFASQYINDMSDKVMQIFQGTDLENKQ